MTQQHLGPPVRVTHLHLIEPHVIAHDVKLQRSGASVAFDSVSVEGQRVSQLVAQRQGEAEVVLLSEAVQHVEHCAAGCFVGLQEHDVGVGPTGAQGGPLSIRGREDGVPSWLHSAGKHPKGREQPFTFTISVYSEESQS